MVIALDSSSGAILRTAGHETYHFVKEKMPDKTGDIENFVLDTLKKNKGEKWVNDRLKFYEKQGYKTKESQIDELVADSLFDVFTNKRAVKDFATENQSLAKKLVSHIQKLVSDIKNIINKLLATGDYAEIKAWQDDVASLEKLNDMFLNVLDELAAKKADNTVETKNTAEAVDKVLFSIKRFTLTESDIHNNMLLVGKMNSVADLSGNEFAKGSIGLPDQVDSFFAKYNYTIENPDIGDVEMNRRGAKDSIAHGIGRVKAASFAAVPHTIEKGKIIDYQSNWKGRQYDTIVLAAPISINDEKYYQGVIVIRDVSSQRFYLHEVLTEKESDTSFKTGAGAKHTPGDVSPSLLSLLKKVRDVNSQNYVTYSTKREQLDVINETNPAPNSFSTWIRTVDDIKTLPETLEDSDWDYEEFNPDLTRTDIRNAIESGKITVYSSYPISNGVFVSPSRMEAESYSGNGKIYEKTVDINDVAWIDPTQGQLAKVEENKDDIWYSSKRTPPNLDPNKPRTPGKKLIESPLTDSGKINYNYEEHDPLSFDDRAKPNSKSSINWVYKAEIFSTVENKMFHQKLAEIRQGSDAFVQTEDGEYIIPIENKLVFTNGDFDTPYISRIVEVIVETQTRFDMAKEIIFDVETGRQGIREASRALQNFQGEGVVLQYTGRDNRPYGWADRKPKGRNRRAAINNYINQQYRKRNASKSGTNQSVTPSLKRDADYQSAVNNGDMKTAQRMVDEAAMRAGYTIKAYHGTNSDFNVFDKNKIGQGYTLVASQGFGFYFTESENVASNYAKGKRIVNAFLKTDNPFVFVNENNTIANNLLSEFAKQVGREFNIRDYGDFVSFEKRTGAVLSRVVRENGKEFTEFLKEKGYDAVTYTSYDYDNNATHKCHVIFDANHIKSADPVTYDNDGNVIPLSKRFDEGEEDIRYARKRPWTPNMPRADIDRIRRLAKNELFKTDNYLDNITKWLYNDRNGTPYFALYSTEDENNPTILYASKDVRAVIEHKFVLDCLKELESESNDGRSKTFGEILERLKNTYKLRIVYSGVPSNGRVGNGNVSVYSRTSGSGISGALLNCLQDSCERRNSGEGIEKYSTKRDSSISEEASNYILDTKEYQEVLGVLERRFNTLGKVKLSPKAIDRYAGRLLQKSKSNYSREQLTERLTALFDFIANSRDVTWEEVTELAANIYFQPFIS